MPGTPTRNVSLTEELERYIRFQVSSGHYSNASEVVRAGLRLLIERDQISLTGHNSQNSMLGTPKDEAKSGIS
jgi:antitoxin ParD1/3/4